MITCTTSVQYSSHISNKKAWSKPIQYSETENSQQVHKFVRCVIANNQVHPIPPTHIWHEQMSTTATRMYETDTFIKSKLTKIIKLKHTMERICFIFCIRIWAWFVSFTVEYVAGRKSNYCSMQLAQLINVWLKSV